MCLGFPFGMAMSNDTTDEHFQHSSNPWVAKGTWFPSAKTGPPVFSCAPAWSPLLALQLLVYVPQAELFPLAHAGDFYFAARCGSRFWGTVLSPLFVSWGLQKLLHL